jgi:CorA-like Mg2+ transporter protein
MDQRVSTGSSSGAQSGAREVVAKHFRNILVWPIHLIATGRNAATHDHAGAFAKLGPNNPWHEVKDEFTGDPAAFQERHYHEFVTFLPPAQRFLYGQGIGKKFDGTSGDSPIKVMRRCDIASARVALSAGAPEFDLKIAHIDLYFFYDIDVAILVVEVFADDIPLAVAQDIMLRFGRAYPAWWEKSGAPGHCPASVSWISHAGTVMSRSDYQDRIKFLSHVGRHRAPGVAAHLEFLLNPLVPHYSDEVGTLRYRQLEYYRMPQMALLALDDADQLVRGDYVRLALANGPGNGAPLPYTEPYLADFESKYCYDRYFERRADGEWPGTRYMSCGHALVVTGDADNAFFMDETHGVLSGFRHQHFLIFLIVHFHKATLLMFSDRLAEAVARLDVANRNELQGFRAQTRLALENFLRFTHRYWFHTVSNQSDAHDLFALCRKHLEIDALYDHIRQEVEAMSQYLENEATRKQQESMARLTVVTTLGLIGTVATGFLGMNLFDLTSLSPLARACIFGLVFVPTLILTFITVARSQRLSEFFDAMGNENVSIGGKLRAFGQIWWRTRSS